MINTAAILVSELAHLCVPHSPAPSVEAIREFCSTRFGEYSYHVESRVLTRRGESPWPGSSDDALSRWADQLRSPDEFLPSLDDCKAVFNGVDRAKALAADPTHVDGWPPATALKIDGVGEALVMDDAGVGPSTFLLRNMALTVDVPNGTILIQNGPSAVSTLGLDWVLAPLAGRSTYWDSQCQLDWSTSDSLDGAVLLRADFEDIESAESNVGGDQAFHVTSCNSDALVCSYVARLDDGRIYAMACDLRWDDRVAPQPALVGEVVRLSLTGTIDRFEHWTMAAPGDVAHVYDGRAFVPPGAEMRRIVDMRSNPRKSYALPRGRMPEWMHSLVDLASIAEPGTGQPVDPSYGDVDELNRVGESVRSVKKEDGDGELADVTGPRPWARFAPIAAILALITLTWMRSRQA